MPVKKSTKSKNIKVSKKKSTLKKVAAKKTQVKPETNDLINSLSSQLKLKESYASLFLGIVVVVVAIVLGGLLLRGKGYVTNPNLKQVVVSPSPSAAKPEARTYTLQEGEGLFEVAEKIYGNGDFWTKIAEANNIENPDYLEAGTKLVIPQLK